MNDRNITNARFFQVIQLPQLDSHLTAKLHVDFAIVEISLVKNNQGNNFNKHNLTKINSITLNTQGNNDNHVITKAYVDQIHNVIDRIRRDLGLSFYNEEVDLVRNNQDIDFKDKKLANIISITVNREPTSKNELANKKFVDDSIGDGNVLRFNQTLENYLRISVDDDKYDLTKNIK